MITDSFDARDELPDDAHKGRAGRCFCVVGSRTMPGASILVARAAQRAGAGLVSVGCLDDSLLGVLPAGAPEAVLVDLSSANFGRPDENAAALDAMAGAHALLVGPGLGASSRARAVLERICDRALTAPLVVDADGLGVLGNEPERLRGVRAPVVLTPHVGEAGRLLGVSIPSDADGRARCARDLAERAGAIVCLKGKGTIITDGERLVVATTGNPGMATAGSGDVLAGILVAYLARRVALGHEPARDDVLDIAARAVHVHGRAGDLAADDLGQRAVIASDLIDALPEAQRELEAR